MELCHYVFQFWRVSRGNESLMYEILEVDVKSAKERLCKLMKLKKVPRNLQIRITYTKMEAD